MLDASQKSSATTSGNQSAPGEDFVRLFTQAQRPLYLFILPLVHTTADADEVLQETNVVMLSKWIQFELGTNFLAWCRTIARLEVFRFRITMLNTHPDPLFCQIVALLPLANISKN